MRALLIMMACCGLAETLTGCSSTGQCWLCESPADARISAQARELLSNSPSLGGANPISVETHHGVIFLRGIVSTPYQIAQAGAIAEQTPEATEVRNLLAIDNSR